MAAKMEDLLWNDCFYVMKSNKLALSCLNAKARSFCETVSEGISSDHGSLMGEVLACRWPTSAPPPPPPILSRFDYTVKILIFSILIWFSSY